MKNIQELAKSYNNVEEVKKAVRSLQSRKSRLRKQKSREDYDLVMTEILKQEQVLKEVRDYFEPKTIPVPEMTKEDIILLNLEETNRAIKSIQSKKCNSQHLTKNILDNKEYQNACLIEDMLIEHKENIKPIEESVVRKSDINDLINHVENLGPKIDQEYIIEILQNLIK